MLDKYPQLRRYSYCEDMSGMKFSRMDDARGYMMQFNIFDKYAECNYSTVDHQMGSVIIRDPITRIYQDHKKPYMKDGLLYQMEFSDIDKVYAVYADSPKSIYDLFVTTQVQQAELLKHLVLEPMPLGYRYISIPNSDIVFVINKDGVIESEFDLEWNAYMNIPLLITESYTDNNITVMDLTNKAVISRYSYTVDDATDNALKKKIPVSTGIDDMPIIKDEDNIINIVQEYYTEIVYKPEVLFKSDYDLPPVEDIVYIDRVYNDDSVFSRAIYHDKDHTMIQDIREVLDKQMME